MTNVTEFEQQNIANSIKPTKLRIAVLPVEEEFEGVLVIPTNAVHNHRLGRVLAVGDEVPTVQPSDIVIYQVNKMFEASVTHMINDTAVMFMHHADAIGKLGGTVVDINNFSILGDYILVSELTTDMIGNLYIPAGSVPPPQFKVIQIGTTVSKDDDSTIRDMAVGDEVLIDRSRATKIRIGQKSYFYVPKGWIHAVRRPI
jgi:co-chaperonin GroES (HSP10)